MTNYYRFIPRIPWWQAVIILCTLLALYNNYLSVNVQTDYIRRSERLRKNLIDGLVGNSKQSDAAFEGSKLQEIAADNDRVDSSALNLVNTTYGACLLSYFLVIVSAVTSIVLYSRLAKRNSLVVAAANRESGPPS